MEVIKFLGPEQCALSIIEGPSSDGTGEVLAALRPGLDALTTTYYFKSSNFTSSEGDRIARLAALRNMALQPLLDEAKRYSSNTTVIFLNDVAICHEDILELVHQRRFIGADMTCAMDWTHPGPDPLFYDVWVSRALNGDLFFNIPDDPVSWDHAKDLFWNEPVARERLAAGVPFQVFACWNGAVTFKAAPVVDREVWFRAAKEGECFQGEPQLFCKDLWYKGYGKIAVVPSVNLEYTDEAGRRVKKEKGYVGEWVAEEREEKNGTTLMVPWKLEPPEMVKCMPMFDRQDWMPWNESLPL